MRVDACQPLAFDARLEREAMVQIADGMAAVFDTDTPPERMGLIVASDNAGTATSVQFWSDAVRTGVAVASPELFPWCVANAPCGALARHFRVTGPNVTLLGESDALIAALDTASESIEEGQVDAMVVIALSFGNDRAGGRAVALRVGAGEGLYDFDLDQLRTTVRSLPLRAGMDLLLWQIEAASIR